MTTSSCDPRAAIERLGGDVALYGELVRRFLEDTSGIRQKLANAVEAGDANALQGSAHSLKGLAASCGAEGVVRVLAELEARGTERQLVGIAGAWQAFQDQMAITHQTLAPYQGNGELRPKNVCSDVSP